MRRKKQEGESLTIDDDRTIRILIVDDHHVVRKGLKALLDSMKGFKVEAEAGNGLEAVTLASRLKPDGILMDLAMPGMGGLEAIRAITSEDEKAHILVLTSFSDDETVFPAIKAGALGYLLKNISPDRLLSAIREVHQGKPSMSSDF